MFASDSVIYLSGPGDQYEPATGSFLGDMTDELEPFGNGACVTEYIGAGPKNYALRIVNAAGEESYIVKVRGIPLTAQNSKKIHFASMRRMVQAFVRSGSREEIDLVYRRVAERTSDNQLVTKLIRKKYKLVYDKRRVLGNYYTVPFGFLL